MCLNSRDSFLLLLAGPVEGLHVPANRGRHTLRPSNRRPDQFTRLAAQVIALLSQCQAVGLQGCTPDHPVHGPE